MDQPKTIDTAPDSGPGDDEVRSVLDQLSVSPEANLIGVLQDVQERLGYLPASALVEIGRRMKTPLSRVYSVVSFYTQFYTAPRGRHTVRCCRGTACHVRGASRVLEALEQHLGVKEGQSTPDLKFYLETVACLGTCFLAPVMMVDDAYYGQLAPGRIADILESFRSGNPCSA